jgi:hypothetical protein
VRFSSTLWGDTYIGHPFYVLWFLHLVIFDKGHKLWRLPCNLPRPPVTYSVFRPKILLRTSSIYVFHLETETKFHIHTKQRAELRFRISVFKVVNSRSQWSHGLRHELSSLSNAAIVGSNPTQGICLYALLTLFQLTLIFTDFRRGLNWLSQFSSL